MILRTLRSDTCGCGNRMGESIELVCECDRCHGKFYSDMNEDTDLCCDCLEKDGIMEMYFDLAHDMMEDEIGCPTCQCTDSFVHRAEGIRICLKCGHSWESKKSESHEKVQPIAV